MTGMTMNGKEDVAMTMKNEEQLMKSDEYQSELQRKLYAKLSSVLTDYEEMRLGEEALYVMLVTIQTNWEMMGLSS